MSEARTLIRTLSLPFACLETLKSTNSEVRLYRNDITQQLQVGKRIDLLGAEGTLAALEATLLTKIRHDHVVPVTEVAVVSGYPDVLKVVELIMPFYRRGSIFDAMFERGERFSLAEGRRMVIEALRGASEINERHGVLHRDHKTPNVFIDDDGRARVGDLGIAIPMEEDGTAEAFPSAQIYTAPETFTTYRATRRSEVYQLGLIAFEVFNGLLAYDENPQDEVVARLQAGRRGPRARDLKFQPHVPRRLRLVVQKALKVRPEDRFANATEMSNALRSVKMIDWRVVVDEDDRRIWEGASVMRRDREYRVEATRARRGDAWRFSGCQRVTRWQRVMNDQIVADPAGADAARFFEAMLVASLSA